MSATLVLIGLGAGAASALLYSAAASGSAFALSLLYVAPLPILIAGVGWRHVAGLIGAVFGAVVLAMILGPLTGLRFALAVGLPSWWLAYLLLLARPGDTPGQSEWYPVGRLVVWCALIGTALVAAIIPIMAGDLEAFRGALREIFSKAIQNAGAGGQPPLPGGRDPQTFVDAFVAVAPGLMATSWMMSALFNLWLAARICRSSGRLVRPWPDLPSFELPRGAALGLAAGFVGSFLPGLPGVVGGLLVATFVLAFTLLGLAVLHVLTRGIGPRFLVLCALYAVLLILPWASVFVAGLGISEQIFQIRRRSGATPTPPAPPAAANQP